MTADEVQEKVLMVWCQVLGHTIDASSDFFVSGGNSLLAMRAVGQMRKQLQWDITLFDLLENPTVLSLSDAICQRNLDQSD